MHKAGLGADGPAAGRVGIRCCPNLGALCTDAEQKHGDRVTEEERVALLRQAKLVKQEGGGRAHPLKEWHSPRTQHKLIRVEWVQGGRQVNFS